jgi:hypothetical protein
VYGCQKIDRSVGAVGRAILDPNAGLRGSDGVLMKDGQASQ